MYDYRKTTNDIIPLIITGLAVGVASDMAFKSAIKHYKPSISNTLPYIGAGAAFGAASGAALNAATKGDKESYIKDMALLALAGGIFGGGYALYRLSPYFYYT